MMAAHPIAYNPKGFDSAKKITINAMAPINLTHIAVPGRVRT